MLAYWNHKSSYLIERWLIFCVYLTWPGVPRYPANHDFWVCLWRCFQNRLALKSEDWVKQIVILGVDRNYSICWGLKRRKRWKEICPSLCLTIELGHQNPHAIELGFTPLMLLALKLHTQTGLHHQLFWVSSLMEGHRTSQSPQLCEQQ